MRAVYYGDPRALGGLGDFESPRFNEIGRGLGEFYSPI
jgi:hypothetical protein